MKHDEKLLMPEERIEESAQIGAKLARLRVARGIRQVDAAVRAGMARSTAVLIEKGDPGRTLAQIFKYLEAIAPGVSLLELLQNDPEVTAAVSKEDIAARFDLDYHFKHIDTIFARVFGE